MSFMAAKRYGVVNVRIRAMKSRFLDAGDYDQLLRSGSYSAFINSLKNTYYGDVIDQEATTATPDPEELSTILSKDFAEVIDTISESVTGVVRRFTETYLEMFLIEGLKSIIRGLHAGLDEDQILQFAASTTPEQKNLLTELVKTGSIKNMIEAIPYKNLKTALIAREEAFEKYESTAPLEVAVEEWYLREVQDALESFPKDDRERVMSILEPGVDLQNLLTRLRALSLDLEPEVVRLSMIRFTEDSRDFVELFADADSWDKIILSLERTKYSRFAERLMRIEEEGRDLFQVEIAVKDYVAQQVKRQLTAFPFHLGIVIGFFTLKGYEIRNISSLAVGVERGLDTDIMRDIITVW